MKWGCRGHWGHWGGWGCWGHWGCRDSKAWKITMEDFRVLNSVLLWCFEKKKLVEFFCRRLLRPVNVTFLQAIWRNSNVQTSGSLLRHPYYHWSSLLNYVGLNLFVFFKSYLFASPYSTTVNCRGRKFLPFCAFSLWRISQRRNCLRAKNDLTTLTRFHLGAFSNYVDKTR